MDKTAGVDDNDIPMVAIEGAGLTVYHPSSYEWMKFLKRHMDDAGAFPEGGRLELIRSADETVSEDAPCPPYDLVVDNIRDTDLSLSIVISNVHKGPVMKSDDGRAGYVVYVIDARVLKCYMGDIRKGEDIEYRYVVEEGIKPPGAGTRHIVSLRKKADKLMVPDAGYSFEYTDRLDRFYEKAAGKAADSPNDSPRKAD